MKEESTLMVAQGTTCSLSLTSDGFERFEGILVISFVEKKGLGNENEVVAFVMTMCMKKLGGYLLQFGYL